MNIFGDFYDSLPEENSQRHIKVDISPEDDFNGTVIPTKGILPEESVKRRLPLLYVVLLFVVLRLLFGLYNIQVVQRGTNVVLAENNRLQRLIINPLRGVFLDSSGKPLVKNYPTFALGLSTSDLPKSEKERAETLAEISAKTGVSLTDIQKVYKDGIVTLDPIVIKENVSREEELLLEERLLGVRGVVILKSFRREYANLPGLGHILGYIGKMSDKDIKEHPDYQRTDLLGKSSLEQSYEEKLRGVPGRQEVEVNSKGEVERLLSTTDAKAGLNAKLFLDSNLQQKAGEALTAGIAKSQGKSGAVVIMNPQTGGILASVSYPYFDDNMFAGGIKPEDYKALIDNPDLPLFNRVLFGQYPFGSTIKPFIASAALMENVVTDKQRINTPSSIEVGGRQFLDWKPHGSADMRQAIAESNNVFFYTVGGGYEKIVGLGIDRIKKYLNLFGFGQKSGVDMPSEAAGNVPDSEWKQQKKGEKWYIGDTYNVSIGQGDVLVTPLQLAKGISAIANGGKLLSPRFVKGLMDASGQVVEDIKPNVERENFIDSQKIQVVREGMRQAVTSGTARPLQEVGVDVAAKTGTAQFSNIEKEKTHAWTVAFAPYNNPEVVVAVVVDGGGESFDIAIPIIKEILQAKFGTKK